MHSGLLSSPSSQKVKKVQRIHRTIKVMAPSTVDPRCISPITEDGSMDRRGNPAVKAKTGKWKSSILLLDLRSHAKRNKEQLLAAMLVNPDRLPTLNGLLLEVYALLRPKPVDYEQRNALVDVFSKMATRIFGTGEISNLHLLLIM